MLISDWSSDVCSSDLGVLARQALGEIGVARLQRAALLALDEHAHRAVGQLEKLEHGRADAHVVQVVAFGIVLGRVELRDAGNQTGREWVRAGGGAYVKI